MGVEYLPKKHDLYMVKNDKCIGKYTVRPTWMFQEVSKWFVNGLFHLLINGVFLGVITHLQTKDPNFLAHPSMGSVMGMFRTYHSAFESPLGSPTSRSWVCSTTFLTFLTLSDR